MANILADAVDILIDQNGRVSYLQENKLWDYDATDTTVLGGSITFNNSDLGEPGIEKLINFVDVDYEGAFTLTFYGDGQALAQMVFNDKSTRGTIWRDYPLQYRKPFQKLRLYISSTTNDTKIYSIEVDFSVLRRRRFN